MKQFFVSVLLVLFAAGAVEAKAPKFGSPYTKQRVELTDETTGNRRVITLEKRADGDYNLESVLITTGGRSSGVLRSDGDNRYSGDIFDVSTATFREVVVVEREDGEFGIEQFDYATGKRVFGAMRCGPAGCEYERRQQP